MAAPTAPSKKGRQAAINAVRRRLSAKHDDDTLWQTINAYDQAQPTVQTHGRAAALVLGAVLETGLETAILTHCVPLDDSDEKRLFEGGEDGPMNFAVKIRLGHALGIYGTNSQDDLNIIRHIRNLFAHDKSNLMFMDAEIAGLCDQIKWLYKFPWGGNFPKPPGPMQQYIQTVRHFYSYFVYDKQKPLKYLNHDAPDLYD